MKKLALAACFALLVGCDSGGTQPTTGDMPPITEVPPAPMGDTATDTSALNLARQNGSQLGLTMDDTLVEASSLNDELGQSHTRFDRYFKGVRIFGGDFVVHSQTGSFLGFSSTLKSGVSTSMSAALSPTQATAYALLSFDGSKALAATVEKVVSARDAALPLAYKIYILGENNGGDPVEEHFLIDANSGARLDKWQEYQSTAASGTGKSLYLGSITITTDSITGGFALRDPNRGGTYTTNMSRKTQGNGTLFTDADNVWGNSTNGDAASAAVDAHAGVALTWDYYKNVHGRNGIANDGKGSYSRVHYGRSYNNAFWSDSCFCMTYGDGDGASFLPLTSLDVAGHEMTHGVTARTANLTYSGESGGLNEATSDIFGTMVEWYANNAADAPDYLIGEKITLFGSRWLRNMADPRADGYSIDHYSQYKSSLDVHYSSGLANNVYYLLAEGGKNKTSNLSVTGIGRAKAEKIWYRGLTVYMTSGTTFSGARAATHSAAVDLYGAASAEVASVDQAWTAAGVN